ncbi:AfsR/SARP family transcriptional regulator [Stackebrandtia nassauensis]|uniref:Transcriptional regulator, SARP family n=1 Tax=Stackebrandtia nassauensis (strain DSM 44728 / CIP 108903 / NRRL B-16338 / NBRC 102104 / LLR-40K-21) TaxID=446470 RepID=D3PZ97_STANL|nr:BTAD domain-containing putative transcriptional regulator [Stackebrandtia nassauensis]ADD41571.1 transcriptional regulator, SARP family [Stackebrandtia nassauensis DSM 44728]
MEFRVLGAVEAVADGVTVDIGPASRRAVLAILLVEVGRVVSVEQLIDRLWRDAPPRGARDSLYSYLSRLRSGLGDGLIRRRSGGYVVTVDPVSVDLHRFRKLVGEARRSTGDDESAELFEAALRLWRGEAFEGLDVPWLHRVADGLAAERFAAELDRNDVQLRRGWHGSLLPQLEERVASHPLDERLAGQLMLARYRSGRQAEALEYFHALRHRLVRELGSEPGPELERLHQRILKSESSLDVRRDGDGASVAVPRQLPAPRRGFVGRTAEMAALDRASDDGQTLWVVAGPGGIGKTWLAVQWGHERRERFPDGQLHVNLRGFDPAEAPLDPELAIRGLLVALGVESQAMPPGLEAKSALYRSLLAGKRMLVVLDNARDTQQVLPLLPGGTSGTTIVTSRADLPALVTTHEALHVGLRPLDDPDAYRTLAKRMGTERIDAEPEAVAELVAHCAGLPLALGILGVRAAIDPELSLAVLARQLREARLDTLDSGELSASVRVVFDSSMSVLSSDAGVLLCLLGIAPGDDVAVAAAASLAGIGLSRAGELLRELEIAHLVDETVPGRFRLHDLTKTYAGERAAELVPEADRVEALGRLVDHYLHAAFASERLLNPGRPVLELDEMRGGAVVTDPETASEARGWFDDELSNVIAIQRYAADSGWDVPGWKLAWTMDTYLYSRGLGQLWSQSWRVALECAEHSGDAAVTIVCHRRLGSVYSFERRDADSIHHLRQALVLGESSGDLIEQGHAHNNLALTYSRLSEFAKVVEHAERAVVLYREAEYPASEISALNILGWALLKLNDFGRARAYVETALETCHRSGERMLLGRVHSTLAEVSQAEGDLEAALRQCRLAISLYADKDNAELIEVLEFTGDVLRDLGQLREAREEWLRARDLASSLGQDSQAESIEAKLASLPTATTTPG